MYVYEDFKNDILINNLRLYLKYLIWYYMCDYVFFICYMYMYIYICVNLDYYCVCKYIRIIFVIKVEKKRLFYNLNVWMVWIEIIFWVFFGLGNVWNKIYIM